jgi:hypothetical protein
MLIHAGQVIGGRFDGLQVSTRLLDGLTNGSATTHQRVAQHRDLHEITGAFNGFAIFVGRERSRRLLTWKQIAFQLNDT